LISIKPVVSRKGLVTPQKMRERAFRAYKKKKKKEKKKKKKKKTSDRFSLRRGKPSSGDISMLGGAASAGGNITRANGEWFRGEKDRRISLGGENDPFRLRIKRWEKTKRASSSVIKEGLTGEGIIRAEVYSSRTRRLEEERFQTTRRRAQNKPGDNFNPTPIA